MMRLFKSKKGLALLAGVIAVVAAAGGAFAYFTNTGSGTDTAAGSVGTPTATLQLGVSFSTVAYTGEGTTLLPTVSGDTNATVANDAWEIKNTTEADELISTYTVGITSGWSSCAGGGTNVSGTCSGGSASGDAACVAADFSVNGEPVGSADTESVGSTAPTFPAGSSGSDPKLTANEYLPPNSDVNTNNITGTATIELIENSANQDACQGASPSLTITAS